MKNLLHLSNYMAAELWSKEQGARRRYKRGRRRN
jgi:hypothetical protein